MEPGIGGFAVVNVRNEAGVSSSMQGENGSLFELEWANKVGLDLFCHWRMAP